ncbi:ceramidase domain-containing protein [Cognatishimia activa]|uniref:Ceramidase domain-containing protein n=1 Tax=Cognatishimia activa TaxID=1715691 RepID=A0A975ENJ2_9RHOB|nr:ceramidase domain-containing protein [Cognatishimia activa]QTN35254.1 ceramidase domain-containing protein [Cognatishimia activa]
MDLTAQLDGYCERIDPSFWSEPVNAITNAAFLIAALYMWHRSRGLPNAQALCAVLFAIGVGSFLFHTYATTWAAIADVTPIAVYVLLYIFLATRDFWGQNTLTSLGAVLLFFPYAYVTVPLFEMLPILNVSAGYGPVPLLILIYAFGLRNRAPETARGLAIGATIILISLTFRSLDMPVCENLPLGTHFMWHILNGIALGWMIEVYRRHMLAQPAKQG